MRNSTVAKVIGYMNTFHSLEGSDHSENPIVSKAMDYAQKRVIDLTGTDIHSIPAEMEKAINHLKKL